MTAEAERRVDGVETRKADKRRHSQQERHFQRCVEHLQGAQVVGAHDGSVNGSAQGDHENERDPRRPRRSDRPLSLAPQNRIGVLDDV